MSNYSLIDSKNFYLIYNTIYFFYFLIIIFLIAYNSFNKKVISNNLGTILSFLVLSCFASVVGFRQFDIGADTNSYLLIWENLSSDRDNFEFVFNWLMSLLKNFGLNYWVFLFLISSLFHFTLLASCKNISTYYKANVFFILFLFFSLFFTLNMSINIIRQGLSLVVLLYAYSLFLKEDKKSIIYAILACAIHTTSIIPIIIFIISVYFNRFLSLKWLLLIYFSSLVLAFLDFGILNIAPYLSNLLSDNRRVGYLDASSDIYTVGFKPQFVAFNSVILLFALIANYYNRYSIDNTFSTNYTIVLRYYLLTSALFYLVFQIPYSDRWGLFSWIVIPILIIPYFSREHKLSYFQFSMTLLFGFIFLFFQFLYK